MHSKQVMHIGVGNRQRGHRNNQSLTYVTPGDHTKFSSTHTTLVSGMLVYYHHYLYHHYYHYEYHHHYYYYYYHHHHHHHHHY